MNIVLFFTRGISLQTWEQQGMLEREVSLYRRLKEHGVGVTFVTYGDATDLKYSSYIDGISILCNRWGLNNKVYEYLIPVLHAPHLITADIFKSNQTKGADIALRAARIWKKPLIARCGYMWSDLAAHSGADRRAETDYALSVEKKVFTHARKVVVTTPSMRDYVISRHSIDADNVEVIPNYVLTSLFSPDGTVPDPRRLCFIGRLSEEKNPLLLVEACEGIGLDLVMVGDGPLKEAVLKLAQKLKVSVHLPGNVPHVQLPDILRKSSLFLLISQHEGHPKTLLEAMACGLPVIATDVPGINNLIENGRTGILCSADAGSIRNAIITVLGDPDLRERLGRNAASYVQGNYSLETIVRIEWDLYRKILSPL